MRAYAKAIVGGMIAGLAFLAPVADDGVTLGEGLSTTLAFIVGFQGVYWTRNRVQ